MGSRDHVIGVHPLLADETTWFLVADFDKTSWQEDVAALRETCRGLELRPAVERSRSGNGAHVWFFFSAPVAASIARRMGCFPIDCRLPCRRGQRSLGTWNWFCISELETASLT